MFLSKRFIIVPLLFFAISFSVLANKPSSFIGLNAKNSYLANTPDPSAAGNFLRLSSPLGGLNAKLMPAFYLNSLGLEVEYPLNDFFTIGINLIGKIGRTDGNRVVFKIRPETSQEASYRVELAAKYYISKNAPTGLYGQFNISFGNLLFFDGTNRPYTLHSRWKRFDAGIRSPVEIVPPRDLSLGVGVGYQLVVIPKKIIANIMVGSQLFFEQDSGIYPSVYISPSLGYVF